MKIAVHKPIDTTACAGGSRPEQRPALLKRGPRFVALLILLACTLGGTVVQAQTRVAQSSGAAESPAPVQAPTLAPAPVSPPLPAGAGAANVTAAQTQLDGWKGELDRLELMMQRTGLSDRVLTDARADAERIRRGASALITAIQPRVADIEARLRGLTGAPPKEGEAAAPVPDAVRQQREEQERSLAAARGLVQQAQVLVVRGEQVIQSIADLRRARFNSELFARSPSILDPTLWVEFALGLPTVGSALGLLVGDWGRLLSVRGGGTATLALGIGVVVALALGIPLRRFLLKRTGRLSDAVAPTRLDLWAKATAIVSVNVGLPVAGLLIISVLLEVFDLAPTQIDQLMVSLILATLVSTLLYGAARAILAPGKPAWRLLAIDEAQAVKLERLLQLAAVVFALGLMAHQLVEVLVAPVAVVIVVSAAVALTLAGLAAFVFRVFAHGLSEKPAEDTDAAPAPATDAHPDPRVNASILWRWLIPLGWLAVVAVFAAVLLGYVGFGRVLANQLVWASCVFALLYLGLGLIHETAARVFMAQTPVGVTLTRSMGFGAHTVAQAGVVLSGLGRLVLMLFAALLLVSPWGYDSGDLLSGARTAFFGFEFAGVKFSPSTLLSAILLFAVVLAITRGIKAWLENSFLPSTRLDVGLRNSITTSVGYVGLILAAVLAFSRIGLDLQNVAIVAGALSVGIGLGLQSIVNNFVSGLILLAERPIKSGDLVRVGDEQGYVRKINVRSTEIETFDRASLIVPNSSLITGTVKNWMHRDATGRAVVNLSVAAQTDPEVMRALLIRVAAEHPLVRSFPEPNAFLVNIGVRSLDFRLVCTVANVNSAFGVESDLRFAIMRALTAAGIQLPGDPPAV